MKRLNIRGLLAGALMLSVATVASAVDTVYLDGASAVRGTVTGYTKDVLKVQQGSNERELPVNTITSVNWDQEPLDLKNARSSEKAGNFSKALEMYAKVKENVGGLSKDAQTDLNYLMARAEARQALASNPSQQAEAIQKLEAFKAANRDHFRYYELHQYLGQLYAAQGDTAKATTAFNEMKSAPYKDYQMAAQILAADALFQSGDVNKAQQDYQSVANMQTETPQELNRKNEARLGLALCQIQQGQPDQAVEIANQVISETEPTQAAVQARAFLRKGDALVALKKPQEAVIAYLAVDLLFASEPSLHAEALYHLSRLWGQIGKADRASDAQARLQSQYPESPWNKTN
ncbi:MAG: tetratricopeptide repeat protein [Planctomycetaceae bacterium]|nr:tetratricopeptide repeat protein [Planctomycetaceae bacterium]